VEANVVREVGIYERQGTMWNQALTAQTVLKDNVFFNCDRASLNINDGVSAHAPCHLHPATRTCRLLPAQAHEPGLL
jgi:hypothetical protein